MKTSEISEILDHVRSWPRDQQQRAAELLIALENADADSDPLLEENAAYAKAK